MREPIENSCAAGFDCLFEGGTYAVNIIQQIE
jgi:hypothetical protein